MKKTLGAVLAVAALLLALPGAAQAQGKGEVIYLIPTLLDEFQTESQKAIEASFSQLGYAVTSLDAQNRADVQLNQFDDAVELEPKAIVLNAVDFDAVVPGIEKARTAGIPVLVFDRQIRSVEVDFTSVSGNVDIGRIAAGEISACWKRSTARPRARCCRSSAIRATATPSTSSRASRSGWRTTPTSG